MGEMAIFRQLSELMFKIGQLSCCGLLHHLTVKAKKPTLKQVQAVRCPTCGAGPGEKCELTTGLPRTEPHRDRRLIAEDDPRTEQTDSCNLFSNLAFKESGFM
jgi:hypothetical protein